MRHCNYTCWKKDKMREKEKMKEDEKMKEIEKIMGRKRR